MLLHESISTDIGVGDFFVYQEGSSSKVIKKCHRPCGYAKQNNTTLVIVADGKYHPLKEVVNSKYSNKQWQALSALEELLKLPGISMGADIKKAVKFMKAATT